MNMFKDKMQDLIWTCSEGSGAADLRSVTGSVSDCHSLWPVTFLIPGTGHNLCKRTCMHSVCVGVELFNRFLLPRLPVDDCWPGLNITFWWHRGQWKTLSFPSIPNRSEYRRGKYTVTDSTLQKKDVYLNMETQHSLGWILTRFHKPPALHNLQQPGDPEPE